MKDKSEIAKLIYEKLKEENIESTINVISDELAEGKTSKLKFTKTPLLNSIGQELGKLLHKENWKYEKLLKLWSKGKRDEKFIVIRALEKISKKDYENSKEFVLAVLNDISDWEVCDQMALRVVVNLAVQNQKEIFNLMEQWIKSEKKWIRRLAIATIPPYIRAKKMESKVCLDFLNKVMTEKDADVKKAIGWALREITKKDNNSVYEFLKMWANTGNKNLKRVIKEGMKKLSKEQQDELKTLLEC